eukprot:m.934170 g.934170  ORF g.934170 m.934170 type:complete len:70 (-) comp23798_c2_seq3:20-229(-)
MQHQETQGRCLDRKCDPWLVGKKLAHSHGNKLNLSTVCSGWSKLMLVRVRTVAECLRDRWRAWIKNIYM